MVFKVLLRFENQQATLQSSLIEILCFRGPPVTRDFGKLDVFKRCARRGHSWKLQICNQSWSMGSQERLPVSAKYPDKKGTRASHSTRIWTLGNQEEVSHQTPPNQPLESDRKFPSNALPRFTLPRVDKHEMDTQCISIEILPHYLSERERAPGKWEKVTLERRSA